uniref:DUF7789 domain-containing protein n=1 Tax=Strigamia maritima TaxID=126957 RepID=T1JJ30_STRMM
MKPITSDKAYVNYGAMAAPDGTKDNDNDSVTGIAIISEFMQRRNSTLNTIFGKIRHVDNIERCEWIFIAIGLVSALASLGLTIERMITLDNNLPDFTFALLLAVNIIFCIYYLLRGILQERPLEIFVFIVTNLIVTVYVIINYSIQNSHYSTLKLVRLIITSIFGSINIALGIKYFFKYWSSSNYVFRITPVPDLQRICRIFLWCEGFLIFDIQFQVSLLILVLKNGVEISDTETTIIIVGVVFTIPWLIVGYIALRKENNILCYIFWATSWISPGYVIYKFVHPFAENTVLSNLHHMHHCIANPPSASYQHWHCIPKLQ